MKKVIYSFLFCMFVMNIHAQLTLEATLTGDPLMNLEGSLWKKVQLNEKCVSFYNFDNETISIYNSEDFNLIETLNVVLSDGERTLSYQKIPSGLYKNDGIEYYLIASERSYYDDAAMRSYTIYKLGVFKKVANNLIRESTLVESNGRSMGIQKNFYDDSVILPTEIWSNGTKCFIFVRTDAGIKVYSFAGTVSNVSQVKTENTEMRPYPNPSREKIHLTFDAVKEVSSIRICDINGKMVERIPVGSDATEYELDVHSYPEGVYFYEIDGKSQSFMVK